MATEVQHGPHPRFTTPLAEGEFSVTVRGRYTTMPRRGAGGVTASQFAYRSPAKRQAELLVLRTCFLHWFLDSWIDNGGTRRGAIHQIHGFPFKKKRR